MRRVHSRGLLVGQPGPVTEAFEGPGGGEGPALDRASDGPPRPRGPDNLTVEVDSPSGRTPASTFRRASRAPSRSGSPGTSGPASPQAVNPALRRGSSMGAGTPGSGGGPPGGAGSTFLSTVASSTILLNMQQKIQAKRLQKLGIKPLLAENPSAFRLLVLFALLPLSHKLPDKAWLKKHCRCGSSVITCNKSLCKGTAHD